MKAALKARKAPSVMAPGGSAATRANRAIVPKTGSAALNAVRTLAADRARNASFFCTPKSPAHRASARSSAPASRRREMPVMSWSTSPATRPRT